MGKKVHPYGLRVGISFPWKSRWFSKGKDYVDNLKNDLKIKDVINSYFKNAGISDLNIERSSDKVLIIIKTSRPGVIIGKQGSSLDELKGKLIVLLQNKNIEINVEEVRKPEIEASLIGDLIINQIQKRFPYRRACKQAIDKAMESGQIEGCKIRVSGRLNGVEIARSEVFTKGKIPLHTIRANIDYFSAPAQTTYGKIGVKVWVNKGEIFADKKRLKEKRREEDKILEINKNEKKEENNNIFIDTSIEI
jgi:small subunit ribosomal protein S3